MTFPFPVFCPSALGLGPLITGGTNIGNMTNGGGLAAAFDGNTNQSAAMGALRNTVSNAYCGKTLAAPTRIFKSISWGANNQGYSSGSNPSVDLYLYAKTGSVPASGTDGTSLGTLSFTDTANESGNPREILSSDIDTLWDHVWLYIVTGGAASNMPLAELELYSATYQ